MTVSVGEGQHRRAEIAALMGVDPSATGVALLDDRLEVLLRRRIVLDGDPVLMERNRLDARRLGLIQMFVDTAIREGALGCPPHFRTLAYNLSNKFKKT